MNKKILLTIFGMIFLISIVIGATLGISDVVITETIDENIGETGTPDVIHDSSFWRIEKVG